MGPCFSRKPFKQFSRLHGYGDNALSIALLSSGHVCGMLLLHRKRQFSRRSIPTSFPMYKHEVAPSEPMSSP
ncbi:hypothetical protein D9613_011322 [Agrocybe pediades]|uniref:Uncharacterized protein n=1 Tax=Agrocybe pediades TaxID=84607 RepID=A0A8H4VQ34_9AGAR|nr:hypothetical protein D9613_011322 [Agrocybe pediades]